MARSASAILIALGKVGIVALIDETTDYQAVRTSDGLRRLVDRLLRPEAASWSIRWKPSLIASICRLYGHRYEGGRTPQWLSSVMGRVYELVFGDEVVGELRRRNPVPR